MNVEIGTEAAQFPEKKYINWIFHSSVREKKLMCPTCRGREKLQYCSLSGLYGRENLLCPTRKRLFVSLDYEKKAYCPAWIRMKKLMCPALREKHISYFSQLSKKETPGAWDPPVGGGKGVVEELRDYGCLAALPTSQKHYSKH
jgi:hypothetical protein